MNRILAFFLRTVISLLGSAFLLCGCKETVVTSRPPTEGSEEKTDLIQAQEISIRQEWESIDAFVKRSGWPMQTSGTGLRYQIYRTAPKSSPKAESGDAVIFAYSLHLLNGVLIDSATTEHPQTVILGHSDIVSGLSEALLMMRKDESGRFILPSHLAYGFSGDGEKIPPQASLLYDITVMEIRVPPSRGK